MIQTKDLKPSIVKKSIAWAQVTNHSGTHYCCEASELRFYLKYELLIQDFVEY